MQFWHPGTTQLIMWEEVGVPGKEWRWGCHTQSLQRSVGVQLLQEILWASSKESRHTSKDHGQVSKCLQVGWQGLQVGQQEPRSGTREHVQADMGYNGWVRRCGGLGDLWDLLLYSRAYNQSTIMMLQQAAVIYVIVIYSLPCQISTSKVNAGILAGKVAS